jgi:L-ascorbate peroxidase
VESRAGGPPTAGPARAPASGDRFFHAPKNTPLSSPVQPSFPSRGGATGSIRFKNELAHGANAGLNKALDFLAPVAAAHADVSFADLIQLAGAVAVEATGGPKLAMRYGRKDAAGPLSEVKEGNLPAGGAPWPAPSTDAASHLRAVFHRMGMSDAEIVALSGAHTIGRARTTRSGFGKESTKYTDDAAKGTPGGASWTPDFQTFNNSYFTEVKKAVTGSGDPDLLVLDTDKVRVRGERKGRA